MLPEQKKVVHRSVPPSLMRLCIGFTYRLKGSAFDHVVLVLGYWLLVYCTVHHVRCALLDLVDQAFQLLFLY